MITYSEETTLVTTTCIKCGCVYGLPKTLYDSHVRLGGFHSCPNGHCQGRVEGEEKKARKCAESKLAIEKTNHDQTKSALKESEEKRSRIEKRIRNGVCPCCNRQFKNVHRHMKSKHPDFAQ